MYEFDVNLKPLLKKLEVFSKKDISGGGFTGGYTSVFKGRGLEFEGYREYTPADDASLIDWKASLRSNELLIKEFAEERNVNVVFALDVSSSMSYASVKKLKNEYAIELIASLAFSILRAGDSIGLLMFSDKIKHYLKPALGHKQYYVIIKSLLNPKLYEGGFDLSTALSFLITNLKKGSIVILVSDFIGLKPDWQKILDVAVKKFDIIGIMIRDPVDNELPTKVGPVVISDPFSDDELLVDPDYIKQKYDTYTKNQRALVREEFLKRRCGFIELTTNKPFEDEIIKFFKQRVKQWR
ncbi:MAG: DUF58 domain-containing protein [Candidatus Woesearchaeota archaeon]